MFTWEDPVTVTLSRSENSIEGSGCCVPRAPLLPADCCGPVTGEVDGLHVSFSFPVGSTNLVYTTDAYLSDDGSRMGGYFRSTQPDSMPDDPRFVFAVAWLPVDDETDRLPKNPDLALEESSTSLFFQLSAQASEGDGFARGETYEVAFNVDNAVSGDFGSFWSTEISVGPNGDLVLGPVPATHPDLPISAVLQRDGSEVVDATVTMPSGATYVFDATTNESGQ